eukprot:21318_1
MLQLEHIPTSSDDDDYDFNDTDSSSDEQQQDQLFETSVIENNIPMIVDNTEVTENNTHVIENNTYVIEDNISVVADNISEIKDNRLVLPTALTERKHLKAMEQIYSLLHHFNINISFEMVYEIIDACVTSNTETDTYKKRRICSHCCLDSGQRVLRFVKEWATERNNHWCDQKKLTIFPNKKSNICLQNELKQDYTGKFHPRNHIKDPCSGETIDGCCLQFPTEKFASLQTYLNTELQKHKIKWNVDCKSNLLSYITTTYTITDCASQFLSQYFKQYQTSIQNISNINNNINNNNNQLSQSLSPP